MESWVAGTGGMERGSRTGSIMAPKFITQPPIQQVRFRMSFGGIFNFHVGLFVNLARRDIQALINHACGALEGCLVNL